MSNFREKVHSISRFRWIIFPLGLSIFLSRRRAASAAKSPDGTIAEKFIRFSLGYAVRRLAACGIIHSRCPFLMQVGRHAEPRCGQGAPFNEHIIYCARSSKERPQSEKILSHSPFLHFHIFVAVETSARRERQRSGAESRYQKCGAIRSARVSILNSIFLK